MLWYGCGAINLSAPLGLFGWWVLWLGLNRPSRARAIRYPIDRVGGIEMPTLVSSEHILRRTTDGPAFFDRK